MLYWLAVVVNKSHTGNLEDEETGRRVKMNKKVAIEQKSLSLDLNDYKTGC